MAQKLNSKTQSGALTGEEIFAMAGVLRRRYHGKAAEIARHFAQEHKVIGDISRAAAWARVAECIDTPPPAPTLS